MSDYVCLRCRTAIPSTTVPERRDMKLVQVSTLRAGLHWDGYLCAECFEALTYFLNEIEETA